MATRSMIIVKKNKRTYTGIYCHFDGHPENVGITLSMHYTEDSKIKQLIDLGGISVLGPKVTPNSPTHSWSTPEEGVTVAYHRDRGEPFNQYEGTLRSLTKQAKDIGAEYLYIWNGKYWEVN